MDSPGYVALTRQTGLLREMRIIANNVANMHTNGFRGEDLIFSEHVNARGGNESSTSMANAHTRRVNTGQGPLNMTKGDYDLAIEGEGYFLIDAAGKEQLTRSGHFFVDAANRLVTADGHPVLDVSSSSVSISPDEGKIGVSKDGTISQNGRILTQLAIVQPINELGMQRVGNNRFESEEGWDFLEEETRVMQGFLEGSNVNAMTEISRMIEVQRAYEMGQSLLEKENDRINSVIKTLGNR